MDIEKQLFVINGRDKHDNFLTNELKNNGYSVSLYSLGEPLPNIADLTQRPKILLLGKTACFPEVKKLIDSCGLINLLIAEGGANFCLSSYHKYAVEIASTPCDFKELILRLQRSIHTLQRPSTEAKINLHKNLIGNSANFISAMALLQRYINIDAPVLISGETGTGKELAARALHYASSRKSMPFQALNCGALPDHLVENELFGHAKGAYTDARENQDGIIALAEGGTLFLDEVDSLSHKAQTALLRFLQDRQYRPIGGTKLKTSDIRIVSATNTDLDCLVKKNLFRQDLIFRLNTLPLQLPPLRFRKADILYLAEHFLNESKREYNLGDKYFHTSIKEKIVNYPWPGNVRELENYVKRSYLLTDRKVILIDPDLTTSANLVASAPASESRNKAEENAPLEFSEAKRAVIDNFEINYINSLLNYTSGNVSRAAKLAGKERRVFGRLMKKHQIDKAPFVQL